MNIEEWINIPPYNGGYFIFGHSPNNTDGAQVRFLLACHPCIQWVATYKQIKIVAAPADEGAVERSETEGEIPTVNTLLFFRLPLSLLLRKIQLPWQGEPWT